jgi:predicted RNA binding protein YcfA (HicA-like mRNA interferase family)
MPKRIPSSEFIAILTSHGFEFVSKRGSHAKYRDSCGHTVIIPILERATRDLDSAAA